MFFQYLYFVISFHIRSAAPPIMNVVITFLNFKIIFQIDTEDSRSIVGSCYRNNFVYHNLQE